MQVSLLKIQPARSYTYRNNITTGAGINTLSVKVKANGRNWVLLYDSEQGEAVYFDLKNGVAGTIVGTPDAYSIKKLPNGWYEFFNNYCYIKSVILKFIQLKYGNKHIWRRSKWYLCMGASSRTRLISQQAISNLIAEVLPLVQQKLLMDLEMQIRLMIQKVF